MRPSPWILAAALISVSALAQQTTDTNCTTSGNSINCTSTTTDRAAQQQRAYEAGQQVGAALGTGIAAAVQAHAHSKWVKNYCAAHPGGGWKTTNRVTGVVTQRGRCPTDEDKQLEAANTFMSKHRDYIPEPNNSTILVAYLDTHKLDPREERSYEHAYKDLKKGGQLNLYAR